MTAYDGRGIRALHHRTRISSAEAAPQRWQQVDRYPQGGARQAPACHYPPSLMAARTEPVQLHLSRRPHLIIGVLMSKQRPDPEKLADEIWAFMAGALRLTTGSGIKKNGRDKVA
jgi:hypothetical protein